MTVPSQNRKNPSIGKKFEEQVKIALQKKFGQPFFEQEVKIGNPPRSHRFDLVSRDKKIIVECKCYSWTRGGNLPSAKRSILNEAAFFFSFVKGSIEKIIVMKKARNMKRAVKNTLASNYFRSYKHLLKGIRVMEFEVKTGDLQEVLR